MIDDEAHDDRQADDLENAHQHAVHVDGDRRVDIEPREQRRGEHADQRRQRADGHRQSHVATRQIDHHVRSGAARDAAHQHHPGGQIRRHAQHFGNGPGGKRHHQIVQHDAGDDRCGPRKDTFEIGDGERHAHRQHDDGQERGDVRCDGAEGGWRKVGGERNQHGPQRKETGNPGKHVRRSLILFRRIVGFDAMAAHAHPCGTRGGPLRRPGWVWEATAAYFTVCAPASLHAAGLEDAGTRRRLRR